MKNALRKQLVGKTFEAVAELVGKIEAGAVRVAERTVGVAGKKVLREAAERAIIKLGKNVGRKAGPVGVAVFFIWDMGESPWDDEGAVFSGSLDYALWNLGWPITGFLEEAANGWLEGSKEKLGIEANWGEDFDDPVIGDALRDEEEQRLLDQLPPIRIVP